MTINRILLTLSLMIIATCLASDKNKGKCWETRSNYESCVKCARAHAGDEQNLEPILQLLCKKIKNLPESNEFKSLHIRASQFIRSNPENEFWMGNLPPEKVDIPVSQLAIPGSHDSFSYSISSSSRVAPDADDTFKKLDKIFGWMARSIIAKWAVTQDLNFQSQLKAGIRYFDMRVAKKNEDKDFYLVHGLFAKKVSIEIKVINQYLKDHPKEVVLLDFNHFYNMRDDDHKRLANLLKEEFGDLIVPFSYTIPSLKELWQLKKQVFIFYHNDDITYRDNLLWLGDKVRSKWPNTDEIKKWLEIITTDFTKGRNPKYFHVSQGILTPSVKTIVIHTILSGGVKSALANYATPKFVRWLKERASGPEKVNICIVDFVEDFNYISTVIGLNTMVNYCDYMWSHHHSWRRWRRLLQILCPK